MSELAESSFVPLTESYLAILKLQFLALVNVMNVNTLILSLQDFSYFRWSI